MEMYPMIRRSIGSVFVILIFNIQLFAEETPKQTILFLGTSLTVGYGLEKVQAFPELIQQKINTRNWPFVVVNAGISGDTSSSGLRRIDWLLKRPIDILILELGANDALRGVPLDITRQNLQKIIDKMREKYPHVHIVIAGMEAPPNMGNDYAAEFRSIFKDLSQKNQTAFIPFLLENVAGHPNLNQPDRIHPTAEGHEMVAENVWKILKPVLENILDQTTQLKN
jgi:acyl-CoA thioesterase-1